MAIEVHAVAVGIQKDRNIVAAKRSNQARVAFNDQRGGYAVLQSPFPDSVTVRSRQGIDEVVERRDKQSLAYQRWGRFDCGAGARTPSELTGQNVNRVNVAIARAKIDGALVDCRLTDDLAGRLILPNDLTVIGFDRSQCAIVTAEVDHAIDDKRAAVKQVLRLHSPDDIAVIGIERVERPIGAPCVDSSCGKLQWRRERSRIVFYPYGQAGSFVHRAQAAASLGSIICDFVSCDVD